MKLFQYSSNNSGGRWWLSEDNWKALANAGWKVIWSWQEFIYNSKGDHIFDSEGYPKVKDAKPVGTLWLGGYAKYAYKKFNTVKECIDEFEKLTGQDVSDKGCNCCGAPHNFSWDNGSCSGEQCLEYMYDNVPTSLREATEKLNKK